MQGGGFFFFQFFFFLFGGPRWLRGWDVGCEGTGDIWMFVALFISFGRCLDPGSWDNAHFPFSLEGVLVVVVLVPLVSVPLLSLRTLLD